MSLQSRLGALITAIGADVKALQLPPIVSALPGSPVDGQIAYYQNAAMATAGVVWIFRYRSGGGTNKWEFVGGPPLSDQYPTRDTVSMATNTWGLVNATNDPTLTAPLAGEYWIEHGAVLNISGATTFYCGIKIGATEATDIQQLTGKAYMNNATGFVNVSGQGKMTLTAAAVLLQRYMHQVGTTQTIGREQCYLTITPIRVS